MIKSEGFWLTESHRGIAEVGAMLRARMINGSRELKVIMAWRVIANELGLTPVSASKVAAPDGDQGEDPAEAYLQ
jgi:phage terminase small subunit